MRQNNTQILTTTLHLPDNMKTGALRLLEMSRRTFHGVRAQLWPHLETIGQGEEIVGKEIMALVARPMPQPYRVWRCEAETAEHILRSQARRKAAHEAVAGVLSVDVIVPVAVNRRELSAQLTALREQLGQAADKYILLNVAEQVCNYYLEQAELPKSYAQCPS